MFKKTVISFFVMAIFVYLQATFLKMIAIKGVIPDITLIILVYVGNKKGSLIGELSGFGTGLLEDFLSLSPLGYHALQKTIIGYFNGYTKGKTFVDSLFFPVFLVFASTLIKGVVLTLIGSFFNLESSLGYFLSVRFWIEVGYNIALSPFIFGLLNVMKIFKTEPGEFHYD